MFSISLAKRASYGMTLLYCVILGYIMVDAGKPQDLSWLKFAAPAWLWAVGPMALYSLFVAKLSKERFALYHVVVQLLFFAGSVYGYYDTFYVQLDAQGALALIFFPIWQYVGVVAGFWIIEALLRVFIKYKKNS